LHYSSILPHFSENLKVKWKLNTFKLTTVRFGQVRGSKDIVTNRLQNLQTVITDPTNIYTPWNYITKGIQALAPELTGHVPYHKDKEYHDIECRAQTWVNVFNIETYAQYVKMTQRTEEDGTTKLLDNDGNNLPCKYDDLGCDASGTEAWAYAWKSTDACLFYSSPRDPYDARIIKWKDRYFMTTGNRTHPDPNYNFFFEFFPQEKKLLCANYLFQGIKTKHKDLYLRVIEGGFDFKTGKPLQPLKQFKSTNDNGNLEENIAQQPITAYQKEKNTDTLTLNEHAASMNKHFTLDPKNKGQYYQAYKTPSSSQNDDGIADPFRELEARATNAERLERPNGFTYIASSDPLTTRSTSVTNLSDT
jgi:hypothetical protein